ncbi:hypothetical protein [Dictyobacter arantiisoli]|nr:hypothetical protein [Dictyobacter arantiisoli]
MKITLWTDELQTMRQAYEDIKNGEEPWVALGNFTNDFFDEDEREARRALFVEPLDIELATTETHHQWAVFCAASIEYLCGKYDLSIPHWIHDPVYAPLAIAWYMVPTPQAAQISSVRERLEMETPEAFKRRNIFCGNRIYLNKREEAEKLRRLMSA